MLYIVATPIGNLEDITYRAVKTLQEVDLIACEDTRTSLTLLKHYGISKPLVSYHSYSWNAKVEKIIDTLKKWHSVALISDAGTPGISDPGYTLIQEAIQNGISVVPIPGVSACITALSASGMPTHNFLYLWFLPVKKWRQTLFLELQTKQYTTVVYESVHRIEKTLWDFEKYFWGETHIVIARELTKKFEEFFRGSISEAQAYFTNNKDKIKWEFVIIW